MLEIKLLLETTGNLEKFEPQMGFEPTTLRDLFGCSNHWATGDSVARKGKMWVFDSSCITQLQSEITTNSIARNCIRQSPLSISEMQPTNHPSEQMWDDIYEMKLLMVPTENSEKSKPQMGFEPTTLHDLFGCSNHWATGDSVASMGEMWDFDSSCITQLQSEITTDNHCYAWDNADRILTKFFENRNKFFMILVLRYWRKLLKASMSLCMHMAR